MQVQGLRLLLLLLFLVENASETFQACANRVQLLIVVTGTVILELSSQPIICVPAFTVTVQERGRVVRTEEVDT